MEADPAHEEAAVGLADVLEASGEGAAAIPLLEDTLRLITDSAALRGRLADARHALGDLAGAVGGYRQALELDPARVCSWWGLACAQASLGDDAAAIESYRRLVALQPSHGMAWLNLGKSLFELGQVEPALEAFRRSLGLLPKEAGCLASENIAVAIPGSPAADNQSILAARRTWAAACLPPGAPRRCLRGPGSASGRPIRLGYVSAFFHKRNWMKPVWGLINRHDRDRFEVHLFSDAPESAVGNPYRQDPRDKFHDVKRLSNSALAQFIEDLDIELLIDLNGYSRPSRLPVFLLRPAPVQIAWFNMFATSGLDGFDYLIGDEHVIPRGEEGYYTERVLRVPGSYLTFEVTYPVPEVGPPPCLKTGIPTFGCLAPQYKITTEVVEAWSRILKNSPGSRLILRNVLLGQPAARDFVHGLFARFGVDSERVELDGPAEHLTFLKRYDDIDIALDTFPYNGGTTTMEALWQGVPVLTFRGDRWAARISSSLLVEARLSEFVAADMEGYIARAICLARDPGTPIRLEGLRRTMRQRLRAQPVCDVREFTRNMEEVYLRITS